MRKIHQFFIAASICLLASISSFAQNNLVAGDLAIVSYQSDADPTNTFLTTVLDFDDRFSIVVLKSGGLTAGTVIYFTDRGWDGPNNIWLDEAYPPNTFGIGSEAVIKWTVPAGGIVQGKEVFFIGKYHDELAAGSEYYQWFAYSDEAGTIPLGAITNETPIVPTALPQPNGFTDGMSLFSAGDNILVYQTGPPAGPATNYNDATRRFITAILANIRPTSVGTPTSYAAWDVAPNVQNESSIPPGLTNGTTCFLMSPGPLPQATAPVPGTVEPDNGKFSACTLSSAAGTCTALQMSTIIYNIANWTYQNTVFAVGTSSSLCTYNLSPASTVTLSSAAGTDAQTVCINTAITPITYNTTGATGATVTGLPAGVSGSWAANVVTITGTPTVAGAALTYTVTIIGGCSAGATTGTIAVSANNTAGSPSSNPTVCVNTAISPNITIATTGATGIGAPTGLPAGVTAAWAANVITISGTPTTVVGSPFNYSIPLTGGCGTVNATGTITINTSSIAPTSISGTTTICSPNSTTLTAVGGTLGTGANYQWGTGAVVGTSPIGGATNSTLLVSPGSTTTYWVRIENTAAPCTAITSGVSQLVTVNQPSVAPTGATGTTSICSGGSTTLTVDGGSKGTGANTQWFTGSCGGTPAGTGDAITVSPTTTTTYYVRYSGTCNTTTCAEVTVTVFNREINVQGNSTTIVDGDITPILTDHTDFGNVIISNNLVRTYTIQNTGTDDLTVGAITVSGGDAALFTVGALSPASPIPGGGGSATFTVTFAPTSTGLKTTTLTIVNNDCDEAPYNFTIQGTGTCVTDPVVTNNNNSGPGSLRQAVIEACPGSTITFANSVTSPISLSDGEIIINKNLTIQGPGANLLTVQNTKAASSISGVFQINSGITASISGLTITGGNNTLAGGGIYINFGGILTVTNSTISGNTSSTIGGGILNNGGTLTVTNSTISNNTATSLSGGGIYNNGGILTVTNSTISGNTSSSFGGGIFNNGGNLTVTNSTISGNTSSTIGGGIFINGGTVNSKNTIIAGNSAGSAGPDFFGPLISLGYNLVGKTDGSTGFTQPTDLTGTIALPLNPLLGPLADNGGPTMTHALLTGSPAIDKGSVVAPPLLTDQRGQTRPVENPSIANAAGGNGSDIGAFEVQCTPTVFTACPGNQPPVNNTPGLCSAVVNYTATASGTPAATYTYQFTGATTGSGNGTGSGSAFNVGVTNVTITATNDCGNPTCTFTVTVVDNQPPTVTTGTIASCYATVAAAEAAALAATSATDNCPGTLTEVASTVGTCSAVVTVRTTDAAGNFTDVKYNTRIDNTPPTVTVGTIASCYATVAAAEAAALAATSATDNCLGTLTEVASTVGTCSAVITVTTTDACGNATAVTYNTRIDNTAPTVTVGTIASCYPTVAAAEAAALAATSATDNCPGALTEVASTVGTCSAVITVTTTDACGNATAVIYNTRIDNTAPTVTVATIVSCYPTVAAAEAAALAATSATDNCPGALTEVASTVGTCSAVVTVTTTDACGNATVVTYNTRIDNQAPTPPVFAQVLLEYKCIADIPAAPIVYGSDVCDGNVLGVLVVTNNGGTGCVSSPLIYTRTWTFTDRCGNSSTAVQTVRVVDDVDPTITGASVNPTSLWPPNHKMRDVVVNYTAADNCGTVTTTLTAVSNEPDNGTGDGDMPNDIEIVNNKLVRLRAERAGNGNGRIYTITIKATDACGNITTKDVTVVVAHNITGPVSGASFKVGSTVNFAGTFWDKPGNRHTATWAIDGASVTGTVVEPSGLRNGTVTGSYKFNSPGVYKLQMNVKDQTGVVSYANTQGDLDAIVVIYDPNGGYTYGGGWFASPAGSVRANSAATGKVSFGFNSNYFKNATNPKGETQMQFLVGNLEFNALNFEYLAISGAKAQYKGSGKITGDQAGYSFIMTVIDGQISGGGGADKIRLKIFNKNTGAVIYDNQPGASDAADPTTVVGAGSTVVIVNTSGTQAPAKTTEQNVITEELFEAKVFPNPTPDQFVLQVRTSGKEPISIRVMDILGRKIKELKVGPYQTVMFGNEFIHGIYFVEILQGKNRKVIKLEKL